jgi:hypothetical protein
MHRRDGAAPQGSGSGLAGSYPDVDDGLAPHGYSANSAGRRRHSRRSTVGEVGEQRPVSDARTCGDLLRGQEKVARVQVAELHASFSVSSAGK